MYKVITFLAADENYIRVLKWSNVVFLAIGITMLGVFAVGFLNK
jgi:hypothetical protein